MIAATQQQQQQQQQQQATAAPPSAEEEALKRNTDCVYFLASPLTCKKGSECEYRHSEYARVNPRDCYYWLNGNCLNPKCGFRHPPLDGLLGNQASASAGSSLAPSHSAMLPATNTPQNSAKQAVPCIFFQKGLCLKGDRCAFLHGPNPTSNKGSHPAIPSNAEVLPQKKASGGPQKISQGNFLKIVAVPADAKPASKPVIGPLISGSGVDRHHPLHKGMEAELSKYKETNVAPVVHRNSSRFNHLQQSQVPDEHGFQNGKDPDEFLRESSPGFDVLVDDELRNSDYYHGEDQYGRTRGHEGRSLNAGDEYDMGHSADYSSVADIDRETYRDPRGYDSYEHMQGQYAWEQHRTSSERMPVGPAHLERRAFSKADSPEFANESDLRYHLSKHRRVNGLRSVVSHDFVPENHVEERGYRGSSRRDSHNLPSHESTISSRLRGRIKLPERSSTGSDLLVEREIDRGRNRGRLSPGRSHVPSHQGRLRDRIKTRVEEDYNNEGRNVRGIRMRRELTADESTDFAGPKSLAELKGPKSTEGRIQQSLGKRKQLEDYQPSEGDLSFQGPMPLSEILKRKREAEAAGNGSGMSLVNTDDNNQKKSKNPGRLDIVAVADTEQDDHSSMKDGASKEVLKEEAGIVGTVGESTEVAVGQYSSQRPNSSEHETEDGMILGNGVEDQEYEGDDQREGDYEYEQVDEGEYYEEGENAEAEAEEEYVDDEDGDDFAKKIGVMYS